MTHYRYGLTETQYHFRAFLGCLVLFGMCTVALMVSVSSFDGVLRWASAVALGMISVFLFCCTSIGFRNWRESHR